MPRPDLAATPRRHTGAFIAYYRVSTARQGASGLGLEAQREAVQRYLNGGDWRIIAEFTEVESGRKSKRPELEKALAAARLHRAPLVVAKMDRLTRSAAFLHHLLEAGVAVRFCDLPQVEGPQGRFLLNSMVAVAELEAEMIGQRTKAALAAVKARGTNKLGGIRSGQRLTEETRAAGRAERTRKAALRAADVMPKIAELREAGHTSLRAIARELNARQVETATGKGEWTAVQVKRVIAAAGAA